MTVRSSGCGRLLGTILVLIGAIILLAYYGVIPHSVSKYWPVLVIALGALLLIRHYGRLVSQSRSKPDVLDENPVIRALPYRRPSMSPPAGPLIIMALGAYLLLLNLKAVSWGVIIAVVLILLGLVVLTRGPRVWTWR